MLHISFSLSIDEASVPPFLFFNFFENASEHFGGAYAILAIRFRQMAGGYEFCFQKRGLGDIPFW